MLEHLARLPWSVYLALRDVGQRVEDRRLGIVTADDRVARRLGIPAGRYRVVHRALSFAGIRRVMAHLRPGPGDVLLDIGCGAGRVLCVAAQYPFGRVAGIERNEVLHALAARNCRDLRQGRVRPTIELADATEYRIPDDATVIFLYVRLDPDTMRAMLAQVLASVDRAPRPLRIAYPYPLLEGAIHAARRFRNTGELLASWRPSRAWKRTQTVHFYDVLPAEPLREAFSLPDDDAEPGQRYA
ncbi:MAG TPA: methyltransferase domain-containing protein [Azospirillaceae bacterium]|nr:methyltransferase domain-containing protein [Azospirillaceae bacterium]